MLNIPFNSDRLKSFFIQLCEIDSPGKGERLLGQYLIDYFKQFRSVTILVDDSTTITGSDTGNIVVSIAGDNSKDSIFFNCHLDVIKPCLGVKVVEREEVFYSAGQTVLGADDKAGIAVLMELVSQLREQQINHHPLELIFTVGEEIGLLGAKAFDISNIHATYGYALDSTGINNLIIGAPGAVTYTVTVKGKAAHAGLNPEQGLSAIRLAAKIITSLPQGRLSPETTCNIGLINGGTATNIIPDTATITGEIRSHNSSDLHRLKDSISSIISTILAQEQKAFNSQELGAKITFRNDYPAMLLANNSPAIQTAQDAAQSLDLKLDIIVAGGGSDANILNSKGLETAIIGVGMKNVHTCDENLAIADLIATYKLIFAIAQIR